MDAVSASPIIPVIWSGLIALVILSYVVLDGFDLGIGMLFALEDDKASRNVMVNTIAPVWDGNETWLVLGGAGLYGAFPGAYSVILPAFYAPVILMVLSLIFRGVAFEFRFRVPTERQRALWDFAFFGGSALATFSQGLILGGLLEGVSLVDGAFVGNAFPWFAPFPVFCGVALMIGYTMLGAAWLFWRTSGRLQERMRANARLLGLMMIAVLGIVSVWSPLLHHAFFQRWFTPPGIFATALAPIAVLALAFVFFRHLSSQEGADGHDSIPFLCALGLFVVAFLGLGYSIFPMIVPPALTIWDAASPPGSQIFLLVGTIVLIPIIMAYNAFAYWIFRGKVEPGAHYH
jgi:cytochrome d ubiquinol oxidase subunit II